MGCCPESQKHKGGEQMPKHIILRVMCVIFEIVVNRDIVKRTLIFPARIIENFHAISKSARLFVSFSAPQWDNTAPKLLSLKRGYL